MSARNWDAAVTDIYGINTAQILRNPRSVANVFLWMLYQFLKMTSPADIENFLATEVNNWISMVNALPRHRVYDVSDPEHECLLKLCVFLYLLNVRLPQGVQHVIDLLPETPIVDALKTFFGPGSQRFQDVFCDAPNPGARPVFLFKNLWSTSTHIQRLCNEVKPFVKKEVFSASDLGKQLKFTGRIWVLEFLRSILESLITFVYWLCKGKALGDWALLYHRFKNYEEKFNKKGDLNNAARWNAKANAILQDKARFETRWKLVQNCLEARILFGIFCCICLIGIITDEVITEPTQVSLADGIYEVGRAMCVNYYWQFTGVDKRTKTNGPKQPEPETKKPEPEPQQPEPETKKPEPETNQTNEDHTSKDKQRKPEDEQHKSESESEKPNDSDNHYSACGKSKFGDLVCPSYLIPGFLLQSQIEFKDRFMNSPGNFNKMIDGEHHICSFKESGPMTCRLLKRF